MGYGQLFTELARYAGAGQARGIAEREALAAKKTAFSEMRPLQQQVEEEQAALQERYAIAGEERVEKRNIAQEARVAADMSKKRMGVSAVVSPYLSEVLGEEAPESTADVLRGRRKPYVIPPDTPLEGITHLMGIAKEREKVKRLGPKPMTMVQLRQASVTPADPEYARSQAVLGGISTERVDVAKRIGAEKPIAPAEAEELAELESMQRQILQNIGGDPAERARRARAYLSPQRGASASAREYFNQMAGGTLMGPQESNFRGIVISISDALARERSGGVIPPQEYARLLKIMPNLRMAPPNFTPRMEQFYEEFDKVLKRRKELATQPRRDLAGRTAAGVTTFPGAGGGIYLEDPADEEIE